MGLKKIGAAVGAFFKRVFSASNLSAAEKWVAEVSPEVADDLMKISATLPGTFTSLETLAGEAIKLVKDVKNVVISKSLAIHLAQSVLTANWPQVEAEAEKLLGVK